MKASINNSLISKIEAKPKPYDIRDNRLTGFLIRVNPTGRSIYVCQYSRGRRINIGAVGIMTPAQARERAKQILGDAAKGIDPTLELKKKSILNYNDFIRKEYGPWRTSNRKGGADDIKRLMSNFSDLLGSKSLDEITPLLIERWRSKRLNEGSKPATVNRNINNLKASLSKAKEWGIIDSLPLQNIKPVKVDRSGKVRFLSKNELRSLYKVMDQREAEIRGHSKNNHLIDDLKAMVIISLNTGLRRGELVSLKWENVSIKSALITVIGENAKSGKTRHIPLNDFALAAIKKLKKQDLNSDLLFSGAQGNKFMQLRRTWNKVLTKAQIENFRWHDMRHHFASWLVMSGVDLNTVRELLGHSDIQMTLRYAHLAPEHKANAVAKLSSINGGAMDG